MKVKIPRDQVEIQDIVHIKEEPMDNDIKDHDTRVAITSETLGSDQKSILFVENAEEDNMNTVAFEEEADPLSVDIKINITDSLHKYNTKSVEKHAFICHVCEAEFQFKPDLILHISSEHVKNEDIATCSKTKDISLSTPPRTLKSNQYQQDSQKDKLTDAQNHKRKRKGQDKVMFKCSCTKTFSAKHFLRTHLARSHLGWYLCNFCEKILTSNKELNKHSLNVHSQAVYACSKCRRVYTSPTYLKSHFKVCKKKDKDKVRLNCDACGIFLQSKSAMEVHLNTHMGIFHQCTECSESFLHFRTMHRHRLIKHYDKGLNCAECFKMFSVKSDLNKHMRRKHNTNLEQFSCAICGMTFKRKDYMSNHIRCIHMNEGKCERCGLTCTTISSLKRHMKTVHVKTVCLKEDEKIYHCCAICEKKFSAKKGLSEHINQTHYGLSYSCNICQRIFHSSSGIRRHIKQHDDPEKMSCALCGIFFKNKICIKEHIKSDHFGKGLKCDSCKQTFSVKCDLYRHMRQKHKSIKSHNLDKYSCALCGLTFKRKDSISDHIRCIHMNEGKCERCGLTYTTINGLKNHLKRVHLT